MYLGFFRVLLLIGCIVPSVAFSDPIEPVTAPEVKRILHENPNAVLIHSLSKLEFDIQHIPGSINIPTNLMDTTTALPKDKSTELVFYCMGVRCKYSLRAALKAMEFGYSRVHWFKGGIPEWRKYDYPMYINEAMNKIQIKKLRVHKILDLIEYENAFLLDVRPFWFEGSQNYIYSSINLPLLELINHLNMVPKDRPIVVLDAFMKQSVSAAKFLTAKGYNVAGVLRGGMNKWEKAAMPVVPKSEILVMSLEQGKFIKGGDSVGE